MNRKTFASLFVLKLLAGGTVVLGLMVGRLYAFEQDQRINSLTLQFGTDSFASNNAFGGSFVGAIIQANLQSSFNQNVTNGMISLLFTMPGLTDLTGTNDPVLQMGIVNGAPMLPPGNPRTYVGNADLDWWYVPSSNEVDASGTALEQIAGSITNSVLNAGPGRFTFATNQLFIGGQFDMSSAFIRAVTGSSSAPLQSTNGFPPGHLASENIDPSLKSFTNMSTGQLKGNVSAASLAGIPIPSSLLQFGGSPPYKTANTMLDLLIGGWTAFGVVVEVKATQPDTGDPSAVVGAGPPYKFTANSSSHSVISCVDKNGGPVPLSAGLKAAGYSAYFTFTSDRVILLKSPFTTLTLVNPARNASGDFHFVFSNSPDAPFTVLTATNVALPLTNWAALGSPTQSAAGFYEFTDPQRATQHQRFYRVRSP